MSFQQKEREKYLLERFLQALNIPADIHSEGESPDFGIVVEQRKIGVEITELFHSEVPGRASLQAIDTLANRILRRARQEYVRLGGPLLHVTVTFFSGPDLRFIRRDDAAIALANLVLSLSKTQGIHTKWRNDYEQESDLDIFAYVQCFLVPAPSMAHWNIGDAGWVAPLTINQIKARVDAKNLLLPGYKKRFDEIWLVVTLEGTRPAQFFDLDALPSPIPINHSFEKAFLFRAVPTRIFPIVG